MLAALAYAPGPLSVLTLQGTLCANPSPVPSYSHMRWSWQRSEAARLPSCDFHHSVGILAGSLRGVHLVLCPCDLWLPENSPTAPVPYPSQPTPLVSTLVPHAKFQPSASLLHAKGEALDMSPGPQGAGDRFPVNASC